jgi:hemoglobin-like flavoprotein
MAKAKTTGDQADKALMDLLDVLSKKQHPEDVEAWHEVRDSLANCLSVVDRHINTTHTRQSVEAEFEKSGRSSDTKI